MRDVLQGLACIPAQPPDPRARPDIRGIILRLASLLVDIQDRVAQGLANSCGIESPLAPEPGNPLQAINERAIVEPLAGRSPDRLDQILAFPEAKCRRRHPRHPCSLCYLEPDIVHAAPKGNVAVTGDNADKTYCKSTEKM